MPAHGCDVICKLYLEVFRFDSGGWALGHWDGLFFPSSVRVKNITDKCGLYSQCTDRGNGLAVNRDSCHSYKFKGLTMIYKTKGMIRWMLYHSRLGVTYHEYGNPEGVGYQGWYEHFGRCIAFLKDDGEYQFVW